MGDVIDKPTEITMEAIFERYRVLLFDAYGVLVHSGGALPGAADLVRRLNRENKPYYILTNDASKLPATAAGRFRGYGLDIPAERIITSGSLLENHFRREGLAGARCAVLGTADSIRYVERAGGRIAPCDGPFEVLVIADEMGFPFLETVDSALTALCRRIDAGHRVHLVLPNPDLIYPKAGRGFGFCAGSVAGMFETALGRRYPQKRGLTFTRLGKPEAALFEEALTRSGTRDMVMIGDQLETDIQGARAFGLDAVWITTGVAAGSPPAGLMPTHVMHSLLEPPND